MPFKDIAMEVGVSRKSIAGGSILEDFDNDGYLDIVATSSGIKETDQMVFYQNNGDGTFTDRAKDHLSHTSQFGMVGDFQDFNNELKPNVVQLDIMPEDNYRQKRILAP